MACFAFADDNIAWDSLGKFHVKNAAYPYVGKFETMEDEVVIMSSFGAFSSGQVYIIPNAKDAIVNNDATSLEAIKLDSGESFVWPNAVEIVPYDVFGENAIHVPDGFLVPFKTNGGIYVVTIDENDPTIATMRTEISNYKRGYFYHMGTWVDMNGDGRKDFLTARSNAKAGHGELLWLEHPEGGLDVENWTEHVITKGPDVNFDTVTFDQYPGELILFSAEFFNEKLGVYRISLTDGTLIESRMIDEDEILAAYSVELVDLNADGNLELLVNNHEHSEKTNGIWAYSLPLDGDLMNSDFTKHTIATNFNVVFNLFIPQMSPGFPYAIWPNGWKEGERAHIFVAGDGDQSAHDLYPSGDNAEDFGYTDALIENANGTVGALAFSDFDEDGWIEIWMPNYDGSTVEVFKIHEGVGQAIYAEEPEPQQPHEIEISFDLTIDLGDEIKEIFEEAFLQ